MITKFNSNYGAALAWMGPVGLAVGLGLNVLKMGTNLYEGKPIFDESDTDKILNAIANTNMKLDYLSDSLETKVEELKSFINLKSIE